MSTSAGVGDTRWRAEVLRDVCFLGPLQPFPEQGSRRRAYSPSCEKVGRPRPSLLQFRGHVLQEGDVFKLGRFKLRVRQMVPGPSSQAALAAGPRMAAWTGRVVGRVRESACERQLVLIFSFR